MSSAKLTPPLHRLHTPSKRMMGLLSTWNNADAMSEEAAGARVERGRDVARFADLCRSREREGDANAPEHVREDAKEACMVKWNSEPEKATWTSFRLG